MKPADKLASTFNNVIADSLGKFEADSWKEQTRVTFQISRKVQGVKKEYAGTVYNGRDWYLKGEWPEQSERIPHGITREDALKIGTTVYMVTTIRQRIK